MGLGGFKGNIWAGDGKTKINIGFFFDERGNEKQQRCSTDDISPVRLVVLWLN